MQISQVLLSEQVSQLGIHKEQILLSSLYVRAQLEHCVDDAQTVHPVAQLMQAFVLLS